MWRYADNLRRLYETPSLPGPPERGSVREEVDGVIAAVAAEGRTLLTEFESQAAPGGLRHPDPETAIADTADEAVAAADAIGYPVVLKL